jgi:hypothetical protein
LRARLRGSHGQPLKHGRPDGPQCLSQQFAICSEGDIIDLFEMTAELALFYRVKEGFGLEVIVTAAAIGFIGDCNGHAIRSRCAYRRYATLSELTTR